MLIVVAWVPIETVNMYGNWGQKIHSNHVSLVLETRVLVKLRGLWWATIFSPLQSHLYWDWEILQRMSGSVEHIVWSKHNLDK
jgi:hypothetical protein